MRPLLRLLAPATGLGGDSCLRRDGLVSRGRGLRGGCATRAVQHLQGAGGEGGGGHLAQRARAIQLPEKGSKPDLGLTGARGFVGAGEGRGSCEPGAPRAWGQADTQAETATPPPQTSCSGLSRALLPGRESSLACSARLPRVLARRSHSRRLAPCVVHCHPPAQRCRALRMRFSLMIISDCLKLLTEYCTSGY